MRRIVLLLLPLLSCTPTTAPRGTPLPKAVCNAGAAPWTPGTVVFRDATADWGLDAPGATGVRLTAADIDGDGDADLVVRDAGFQADDFAEGGVRHNWVLRNAGGRFEDVTQASGLFTPRGEHAANAGRPGEIIVFGDVDNDGDLDAYTGLATDNAQRAKGQTSEVMLNDGTGRFALGPAESAVRRVAQIDVPAGASFADYDLDGKLDLWVPQHNTASGMMQRARLFQGAGDGSFAETAEAAGIVTLPWNDLQALNEGRAHARAWAAAACDLNGDGLPELLAPSYGRAPNLLWQAARGEDGAVTFQNRSAASGYAYDENFSFKDNEFFRCWCLENKEAAECEGVPRPVLAQCSANWEASVDREPFRLGGNSGSTVCADIDNNGHTDLLTTEIHHWWAGEGADSSEILVNTGASDVRFTRPGRAAMGIEVPHAAGSWDEGHMTAAVFDFDNDRWPDVYIGGSDYEGNYGLLYHQKAALQFESVPVTEGIDHHRSHGVAVADFDRDGDLDVVVGHSKARCGPPATDCYPAAHPRFFENVSPPGNWVQLRLEGADGSNRAAIGARVEVSAGGVTQTQEVGGGHGHYGAQNDLVLHFGLATECSAQVVVRWPDAARSAQEHVLPAGHRFLLKQGADPVVVKP